MPAPRKPKTGSSKTAAAAAKVDKKEQKKKLNIFLADFGEQGKTRVADMERFGVGLCKQVDRFYAQEIFKIPKSTREINLDEYLAGKCYSMTAALGKIEQEINEAIQMPATMKKQRTAARLVTPALLPPPSKPTTRRRRGNTDSADKAENVLETATVRTNQKAVSACATSTPYFANGNSNPTSGAVDKTIVFDTPFLAQGGDQTNFKFDMTRTITKSGNANENIPLTRKPITAATVMRKALPDEIVWSSRGSPIVVDPRSAIGQRKVQAAISLKQGTMALTDSPLSDTDKGRCPLLDSVDIEAINKLQNKLAKIVEFSKKTNAEDEEAAASTSKR